MKTPKLSSYWCEDEDEEGEEWIYKEDGECSCGLEKHHYHCPKCGKVKQVG